MGLAWMMNISSLSHSWCAGLGVTKCYSCMTRFMVLVIASGVAVLYFERVRLDTSVILRRR